MGFREGVGSMLFAPGESFGIRGWREQGPGCPTFDGVSCVVLTLETS